MKRQTLLPLLSFLLMTGGAAAYMADFARAAGESTRVRQAQTPAPGAAAPPAGDSGTPPRMEVERITVRRYGFEPAQITRPAGPFVLALDNRGGTKELDLRLTRAEGGWGRQRRLSGRASRWRAVVDPPPGLYVLREADHPGWECRILITPR